MVAAAKLRSHPREPARREVRAALLEQAARAVAFARMAKRNLVIRAPPARRALVNAKPAPQLALAGNGASASVRSYRAWNRATAPTKIVMGKSTMALPP